MSALHTTAGVGFPKETKTYDQIHASDERYQLHNDGYGEDSEHQYAEESGCEDPEDEVDDLVKEDMKKLDDSFRGISKRYRLVNRIGEGMPQLLKAVLSLTVVQGPFLPYTKQRICYTMSTKTIGTCSETTNPITGRVHRQRNAGWKTDTDVHCPPSEKSLDTLR